MFFDDVEQSYPKAEKFKDVLYGTPASIGENFHWAVHLIEEEDITQKYEQFVASTKFTIDGPTLSKICLDSFSFCREVYDTILFPPDSPDLTYHNLDHGLITSVTAQKIFLGGLVSEASEHKITLPPAEILVSLHRLFSLVSCFHEINDWWNLPYPNTGEEQNPHITEAKTAIAQRLKESGLSTHDFNRLLAVDDFREDQDVSLQKSLELKRGEGFLPDNNVPSLFDQFTDDERKTIFKVSSSALCASDFLQVINPAYLQRVLLSLEDEKKSVNGFAGPYALAWEMQKWRKNALKPAEFGLPDGTVFWDKISLSEKFFHKTALPRIQSGLNYLRKFAPNEYNNAFKVIGNKIDFFRKQSGLEEILKEI